MSPTAARGPAWAIAIVSTRRTLNSRACWPDHKSAFVGFCDGAETALRLSNSVRRVCSHGKRLNRSGKMRNSTDLFRPSRPITFSSRATDYNQTGRLVSAMLDQGPSVKTMPEHSALGVRTVTGS